MGYQVSRKIAKSGQNRPFDGPKVGGNKLSPLLQLAPPIN